jgi:(p)ppGpp synthase/HD superfamily hydrolase
MTSLIEKARDFAHAAHDAVGQERAYTGEPYWRHVDAVAELVASVTDDEITIAAAYLHDTVEDTPTTFDDIAEHFGSDVATVVVYLTDISTPKDGNRATRKAIDRAHNARGDSRVHTVKLADLIDNAESIAERDPHFAAVYMEEKRLLLDVLGDGHPELLARARAIIDRWFAGE